MRHPLLAVLFVLAACGREPYPEAAPAAAQEPATPPAAPATGLTVYVALDEQWSRPLLDRFARELGVDLVQRHDSEAAKTVGLVSAILEERSRPRCSVFWNNELAHTVRLAQEGLLAPYDSPAAKEIPAPWRDPQGRWHGFAARARVLIVNTEQLPDPTTWPTSYRDLVDPKWQGRCAVARPLTGTTLTHFTALRKALGDAEFDRFFAAMQANDVKFLASNGATMRETRDGKLAWAFTDTDDYHVAKTKGFPVACVFPDQGEGQLGTMLIPNSVALIADGPDQQNGKRLIDKILAAETEALLAAAAGAQIPLRPGVPGPQDPAILAAGKFRAMAWDVEWTAQNLARCSQEFGRKFGL
ncbi:MAG: extracellular solute-binding protein [Planctomycetes bacterium]|nr:extracellular solute-binding protein [Planctomycetota bacterium]